jgi:hypothetical protein
MSDMIIVKIQGGLGNQMFQYAAGLSLSIERGDKLILDLSSYAYDHKRRFQLHGFPSVKSRIESGEVGIFDPSKYRGERVLRVGDDFRTFSFPHGNIYLDGYWQSERFFLTHADFIRSDFFLPDTDIPSVIRDMVSVHVRRTDYLVSNGYHPVLPTSYYDEAITTIGDGKRPFVFSDDIEWCKTGLRAHHFANAEFSVDGDEFRDLTLMSSAAHNIIANSSFSWWGAWLNQTPGRRVVAPKTWFGQVSGFDTTNIVPGGWLTI